MKGVSKVLSSPALVSHSYAAPALGVSKIVSPVSSVYSHGYAAPSVYGGYGYGGM